MNRIKIGELSQLVPYMTEVKLSYDAVFFRGVYPDAVTGTAEPFFVGRELSKMSADEKATLFDLVLPNGEKFSDVLQKVRNYYGTADGFSKMPADARTIHLACHETHVKCKHYGGFCNYCFKHKQIIKDFVRCMYFEPKIKEKGEKKNVE